jgi:hypothetical protein
MSLAIIKAQIDRFLETDTPEVMAIKGAWGVGKTFAWNKYLNEAKREGRIALDKYSYISLFGLNSLDVLKLSIFMEVVQKKYIGNEQELDAAKTADKIFSSVRRKSIGLLKGLPYTKDFWPIIEALSFYSLKKTLICIDDVERTGKSLDVQDVMGLVNLLKEQKKCKVVLILNDEFLEEKALHDYKKYREKVVDKELIFSPSAQECADIALSDDDKISEKLKSFIANLGINNIRIIKKIERLSKDIAFLLTNCEEELVRQALHSLTLFAWCFYGPKESVPDYEFVKNHYDVLLPVGDKEEEPEKQKGWKAILRQYGYQHPGEFDLQVASAVEHGYIDVSSFLHEARKLNQQIIATKSHGSFLDAWSAYRESFDDNAKEVVDKLYKSLKSHIKYLSPLDLDGTVRLFRELGEDDLANKIIDLYIDKRKNDAKEIFDLSHFAFRDYIKDKKIIEKFAIVHKSHSEKRTLKEVLAKIAGKSAWNEDDEMILANSTPEEYYTLFKSEKGPHLASYVDTCLQFGRFGGTSERQKKIAENATIALRKIGKEGPLNAMRVGNFGIKSEKSGQ